MNTKMKLAFGCYSIAILIIAVFGVVYLVKGSFMPYHSAVVGMEWNEVPAHFKILITALMRAFGGACIALSIVAFVILFKQFPKGNAWARWCLPMVLTLASLGGLYAMSHVMLYTQASPPWGASAVIIVLSLVGYVLSSPNSEG